MHYSAAEESVYIVDKPCRSFSKVLSYDHKTEYSRRRNANTCQLRCKLDDPESALTTKEVVLYYCYYSYNTIQ